MYTYACKQKAEDCALQWRIIVCEMYDNEALVVWSHAMMRRCIASAHAHTYNNAPCQKRYNEVMQNFSRVHHLQ